MSTCKSSDGKDLYESSDYFDEKEHAFARLDVGWAKAVLAFRTHHRFGHRPRSRLGRSFPAVHNLLQSYKSRIDSGDTLAILDAIQACSEENLPLPSWLELAFREALQSFYDPAGPLSLDKVFARKSIPSASDRRTKKRAIAARRDGGIGVRLWDSAWTVALDDQTLTSLDAVVREVLKKNSHGFALTKAKQLISRADENQSHFLGKRELQPLSLFLAKRRKRFK